MRKDQMLKLQDGALLQVKGRTFMGNNVDQLIIYDSKYVSEKGYRTGGWLYPFEWFSYPKKSRVDKLIKRIRDDAEKQVKKYKDAYELTMR